MSEIARLVYDDDILCHHGVKNQKHGVRRWQYPEDARSQSMYYDPHEEWHNAEQREEKKKS